jgi:hypothetical protein
VKPKANASNVSIPIILVLIKRLARLALQAVFYAMIKIIALLAKPDLPYRILNAWLAIRFTIKIAVNAI